MAYVPGATLARFLSLKLTPYCLDLSLECVHSHENIDFDTYALTISGAGHGLKPLRHEQVINLPKVTTEGTFVLRGLDYAFTRVAYQDLTSLDMDYIVDDKSAVLARILQTTLIHTFTDFYYRVTPVSSSALQSSIDSAIASSKFCQLINPDNTSHTNQVLDSVYLVNDADPFDVDRQAFPDALIGKLDPATTSSSGTINNVFRVVNGTTVDSTGRLVPGSGTFSRTIEDSGIGLAYTPKRLNLLSAQFSQSLRLTCPQAPTVSGPNNQLDGRELVTAVMDLGADTFEDAFMVSESASRALTCIRSYRCRFLTDSDVTVNVSVGQAVDRSTVLAEYTDTRTGEEYQEKAKKIFAQGNVVSIDRSQADLYGLTVTRWDIVVEERQVLQTGDKITTRGGLKGVAIVRPDSQMPALEDGTPVDVVVSPKSIYNRQSVVTLWEMMMNLRGQSFTSTLDSDVAYEELVSDGYDSKCQLTYNGKDLEHETFCAPLFIFRLDKLAHESISCSSNNQILDDNGLIVETSSNGQRTDLGYSLAVAAKDMPAMFESLTSPTIPGYVRRMAAALSNEIVS